MKSTIAILSTLALYANAQLTYDTQSQTIKCPTSTGKFCVGPNSGLIVICANGTGTVSPCGAGGICEQTSPSTGDATCAATSSSSWNSTAPCLVDANSADCDCTSSSSAAPPPPSSTPVSPILTSSKPSNLSTTIVSPVIPSSTPCETTSSSSSSTIVSPIIPSSTPCTTTSSSTTIVSPVIPSSTPCESSSTTIVSPIIPPPSSHWSYATGTGTGTGHAYPTTRVTTLNSSWKPTLTASSSASSSTLASPVFATNAAVAARGGVNALALGVVGIVAALV